MAKDIDLTSRATGGEMPTPPKKEKKVDASGLRSIGTANPVNALPLAAGQVVKQDADRPSMTPQELHTLQQTGWKPGDPIPDNVAEAVAAAQAANQEEIPPVPMDTPPVNVETVDIEQLDPAEQAHIRQAVAEGQTTPAVPVTPARTAPAAQVPPDLQGVFSQPAAAQAAPQQSTPSQQPPQPASAAPQPEPDVSIASQAVPGWQDPSAPGRQPTVPNPQAYPDQGMPTQAAPPDVANQTALPPGQAAEVVVDVPPANQAPPQAQAIPPQPAEPQMAQPEQPAQQPEAPTHSHTPADTGISGGLANCPHCGWDLAMPDMPEPSYGEKQAFLQSVLGQKPFVRDYDMFGGQVKARFRTLSTKEIDMIFKQVMFMRERNEIPTVEDYWELVNRYRVYLQLCRLETSSGEGFLHDLPMGYSEDTNPHAGSYWKFEVNDPRQTGLPLIEKYMLSEVMRTEVLQRTVTNLCGQFNRMVAKLEAVVDNSDFWNATGEQS
jgi:hypothetical protein